MANYATCMSLSMTKTAHLVEISSETVQKARHYSKPAAKPLLNPSAVQDLK